MRQGAQDGVLYIAVTNRVHQIATLSEFSFAVLPVIRNTENRIAVAQQGTQSGGSSRLPAAISAPDCVNAIQPGLWVACQASNLVTARVQQVSCYGSALSAGGAYNKDTQVIRHGWSGSPSRGALPTGLASVAGNA